MDDDGNYDNWEDASLTETGWFVAETIERMINLDYSIEEICEALDLPTVHHMYYMLGRAQEERAKLESDILGD